MRNDERARVGCRLEGGQRVVDRCRLRTRLPFLADAARQVALGIDVDQQDALDRPTAREAARLMVVVVLPTPPFWLATATIRATVIGLTALY